VTREEIRDVVRRALSEIAPEADLAALSPDADLRAELDLDSMDYLGFLTALHRATGVEIPERDARALGTLAGAVEYLEARCR
jgi:acyl carrier protein